MGEGESASVEHGPLCYPRAVGLVTEDREAEGREVQADLVLATRLELYLEEGPFGGALQDPEVGPRLVGGFPLSGEPSLAPLVGVVDGEVDLSRIRLGAPEDEREVGPFDPVLAKEAA